MSSEQFENSVVYREPEELNDGENLALRAFQNTRCEHAPSWVLGGVVGGLLTSIFVNAQAGLCIAAMTAGSSFLNTLNQGNKRLKILRGDAPITSVMNAEILKDYKQILGEEEYNHQLDCLGESDLELSKDLQKAVHSRQLETSSKDIKPDDELALCYSNCCLILASSGAGKDFLVSNAIRKSRQQNPNLKLYVLDPKGLPHEKGYYEEIATVFDSRQCGSMADSDITNWIKIHIEKFQELSQNPNEQWLLILTEATLTGGAFSREKDDYLASFLDKFTCTSNGFGNAVWVLAQFPNLKDLGISNNARTQLQTFAILNEKSISKVRQWVRSKVVPKCNEDDLRVMCSRSEVGRAFYSPVADRWAIMPRLTNYSGYDRDSRKFLTQSEPEHPQPKDQHQASRRSEVDKYDEVFEKLLRCDTDNLAIAIQSIDPVDENKLSELMNKIKNQALRKNRVDVISKFKL